MKRRMVMIVVSAWLTAAGCSSGAPTSDRCEAVCDRIVAACPVPSSSCLESCTELHAVEATCGSEAEAWLSCLETVEDGELCAATSGGGACSLPSMELGRCGAASTTHCEPFGTCRADLSQIDACTASGAYEYRTATRTFTCASSTDCTEAQNALIAFCGP